MNDLQRNIDLSGKPTPETIRVYFLNLMNQDSPHIDYDELIDVCSEGRDTFDLLPAVCFHLSVLAQTPEHVNRSYYIVERLAQLCLEFNLVEAGHEL